MQSDACTCDHLVVICFSLGTLLDGEPIINLPPKTVELKKVDFTSEERDFYCRLEADSRAQFAVCSYYRYMNFDIFLLTWF